MEIMWVAKLKTFATRNRPSRKPQLWENLSLAFRRRMEFEVQRRLKKGWLDQPRVIDLSGVGFDPELRPLEMEVVPREVMNKALFLYGTFEISETRLVQSFLRPGMTFVDVGANIGYYTLVAARLVGPEGAVHTFEPNVEVADRLERNVRLNGLVNTRVYRQAMAGRTGDVHFYASAVSENSGISSIVPGSGLGAARVVPAVSLDDFSAQLSGRGIDLLKMDIEGAELQVIEGGRRVLGASNAPALLFESFDVKKLLPTLEDLGYRVKRLHYTLGEGLDLRDPRSPEAGLFDAYESPNYFASKEERTFRDVMSHVNVKRPAGFRMLGRL
jgi:FkbM family methyltransferase